MEYRNITEGTFVARPNRFIARVMIGGKEETVHVKNTGRCRELLIPGAKVFLERSENPARKTAFDLVAVVKEGLGLVNMDSQAPNRVVEEWLSSQRSGQTTLEHRQKEEARQEDSILLGPVSAVHPEYTYGNSRMDFYFECGGEKCLMEVKGVTLERNRIAYFPDAPTQRGVKHIRELEAAQGKGYHCYLAFVIQMPGITEVYPNDETHPAFGEALRQAYQNGVQVLALECDIQKNGLSICRARRMNY